MKVVFHIDELEKWEETTKNVKNLVKIAPEIDTVILLNGIAINGFLEEKHLSFISVIFESRLVYSPNNTYIPTIIINNKIICPDTSFPMSIIPSNKI